MIVDPDGDLVLDSQSDAEIIVVHRPQFSQSVFHLGITSRSAATQIDDTVFATSSKGVILASRLNVKPSMRFRRHSFLLLSIFGRAYVCWTAGHGDRKSSPGCDWGGESARNGFY